jgi:hypothetical protein
VFLPLSALISQNKNKKKGEKRKKTQKGKKKDST